MQGEHGTGRNVAPFVEMEWGTKAYDLMWELKQLFDPTFVLNPGVVLNRVSPIMPACFSADILADFLAMLNHVAVITLLRLLLSSWLS